MYACIFTTFKLLRITEMYIFTFCVRKWNSHFFPFAPNYYTQQFTKQSALENVCKYYFFVCKMLRNAIWNTYVVFVMHCAFGCSVSVSMNGFRWCSFMGVRVLKNILSDCYPFVHILIHEHTRTNTHTCP